MFTYTSLKTLLRLSDLCKMGVVLKLLVTYNGLNAATLSQLQTSKLRIHCALIGNIWHLNFSSVLIKFSFAMGHATSPQSESTNRRRWHPQSRCMCNNDGCHSIRKSLCTRFYDRGIITAAIGMTYTCQLSLPEFVSLLIDSTASNHHLRGFSQRKRFVGIDWLKSSRTWRKCAIFGK